MTEQLPGNPHYSTATLIVQRVTEEPGAWYDDDTAALARALVQAQLAVAFELRTQALIACSQKVYLTDSPDEIRTRMGHKPMVGEGA